MNNNHCVCCNKVIPSGRQICWICEREIMEGKDDARTPKRTEDKVSEED